jgi:peptide/nickel transport system permease protein
LKAVAEPVTALALEPVAERAGMARLMTRNRSVLFGGAILAVVVLVAVLAPVLGTSDPAQVEPVLRNKRPGAVSTTRNADGSQTERTHWMGTDSLGRDVYSRVVYGARVSLVVGLTVALLSTVVGLVIGVVAGYVRWLDGIVMRIMDGLMSIPAILLAIGLVSLAGLRTVIIAIVIPEVPRVVRLVRSVVLSIREEPYVEAATALGARTPMLLARHVLPNTLAPLIVQGTFICASAILVEAILSFLGVGIPPETPTWGNIMAEGRALFRIFPHNILFPGVFLALTVLAVSGAQVVFGGSIKDCGVAVDTIAR